MTPIKAAAPYVVSLLEQITRALGTWHRAIDFIFFFLCWLRAASRDSHMNRYLFLQLCNHLALSQVSILTSGSALQGKGRMECILEDGSYSQMWPYDSWGYEHWNINLYFLPHCVKYIFMHLTNFPFILTPSSLQLTLDLLMNNVIILFIVHDIMELPLQ